MTAKIIELKPKLACEINLYFHCKECFKELPDGMSPKEYADTQAGWTKQGFQIWCNRHDRKIIHVDFEGQKHKTI